MVDYVIVVNAGDSNFKVGDYAEKSEMEKVNSDLKDRKKKAVEVAVSYTHLDVYKRQTSRSRKSSSATFR